MSDLSNQLPPALRNWLRELSVVATNVGNTVTSKLPRLSEITDLTDSRYLDPLYKSRAFRLLAQGRFVQVLGSSDFVNKLAESKLAKQVSNSSAGELLAGNSLTGMIFGAGPKLKQSHIIPEKFQSPNIEDAAMFLLEYENAVRSGKLKAPSMDFSERFDKALEVMRMMDEILADVPDEEDTCDGQEARMNTAGEEDEDGWLFV